MTGRMMHKQILKCVLCKLECHTFNTRQIFFLASLLRMLHMYTIQLFISLQLSLKQFFKGRKTKYYPPELSFISFYSFQPFTELHVCHVCVFWQIWLMLISSAWHFFPAEYSVYMTMCVLLAAPLQYLIYTSPVC